MSQEIVPSPSPSYSLTLRLKIVNKPGMLGRITSSIGKAGGDIGAIDIVSASRSVLVRDITVNARNDQHSKEIFTLSNQCPALKF